MRMKMLVSIGFVVHALLGNVCMMPMAYAASMPLQPEEVMEMAMTPMFPMSPAPNHCKQCAHVQQRSNAPMSRSCAGHCLSRAHDSDAAVLSGSSFHQAFVVPAPAFPGIIEPADIIERSIKSLSPPVNIALTRSVVLLQ